MSTTYRHTFTIVVESTTHLVLDESLILRANDLANAVPGQLVKAEQVTETLSYVEMVRYNAITSDRTEVAIEAVQA